MENKAITFDSEIHTLPELYTHYRKQGVLTQDLKMVKIIAMSDDLPEYAIDIQRSSALRWLLDEITKITIEFPDDTMHLRHFEKIYPEWHENKMVIGYYILSGLRYNGEL